MPLAPDYLVYPHRSYGMDHDWYDWAPLPTRGAFTWPGGKTMALSVVVPVEFFPLNPSGQPFKAPGAMQTPYPDLRHFTTRDYGNRIGLYRLLDLFAELNLPASFAVQSEAARRFPGLVDAIRDGGHEIIAHGVDTDHLHATGVAAEDEKRWIAESLDTLERLSGTRPRGWLSPAFSESFDTLAHLAGAGLEYVCDWVNDDLPYEIRTENGPLLSVPLTHELDDRMILITMKQTEDQWAEQIADAADWMAAEAAANGARTLRLLLTPYIAGLPYRIAAARQLLRHCLSVTGVWPATAGAVADAFRAAMAQGFRTG